VLVSFSSQGPRAEDTRNDAKIGMDRGQGTIYTVAVNHTHPKGDTMRTNVVLDEQLVAHAQELTGIVTKRGVIEEALRVQDPR
jgi:hypothetical protein